jgi:hypothetical protein
LLHEAVVEIGTEGECLDLEFASIAIAVLALAVSVFTQWQRRRDIARAALPIVRAEWTSGDAGHAVKITLVNRLDEDLLVSRAEAKARLMKAVTSYDAAGGMVVSELIPKSASEPLEWRVLAKDRGVETFRIDGADSPRWIRITVSSSNSTLRRKRLVVSCT